MGIVRYTIDPTDPPRLGDEQRTRLDAMTSDEVERNAIEDPDNPPSTDEQLERGRIGRGLRSIRAELGLSQSEFADRFHINRARLRDWEQGRSKPDSVAMAYLRVIEHAPKVVAKALAAELPKAS